MGNRLAIWSFTFSAAVALGLSLPVEIAHSGEPQPVLLERAPAAFAARVETTKGDFVVEAYRSWAPHSVDRFYKLVRDGYFDGNVFFYVGFADHVQFGLHSDPAVRTKAWSAGVIPSDPPRRKILTGDLYLPAVGKDALAQTLVHIQTGPDGSVASRQGVTSLGASSKGLRSSICSMTLICANPRRPER